MEIIIVLTGRCNLKCKMCDIPIFHTAIPDISYKKIKNIIDEGSELGFNKITFTGGEPLLRSDIIKIIRYAKSKKFFVVLNSNGTLIDKELVRKLKLSKIDFITISIDGTHDIHDKIRGKGNYNRAIRGIKLLIKNNMTVAIASVIMKENFSELSKIIQIAHELNVKRIVFQPFRKEYLINKFEYSKYELNPNEILKLKKRNQECY